ncbi:hypothetical protein RJ640_013633 [Escallonia rubra]|uniref:Uncharacterized protein n=1 Tax=Escallonia rubra TaxID=112253 RepID=A0AA88R871_9ASTE|nr:hypothetical protein RJ640_013633 [Escallonia rubra]
MRSKILNKLASCVHAAGVANNVDDHSNGNYCYVREVTKEEVKDGAAIMEEDMVEEARVVVTAEEVVVTEEEARAAITAEEVVVTEEEEARAVVPAEEVVVTEEGERGVVPAEEVVVTEEEARGVVPAEEVVVTEEEARVVVPAEEVVVTEEEARVVVPVEEVVVTEEEARVVVPVEEVVVTEEEGRSKIRRLTEAAAREVVMEEEEEGRVDIASMGAVVVIMAKVAELASSAASIPKKLKPTCRQQKPSLESVEDDILPPCVPAFKSSMYLIKMNKGE